MLIAKSKYEPKIIQTPVGIRYYAARQVYDSDNRVTSTEYRGDFNCEFDCWLHCQYLNDEIARSLVMEV